MPPKKKGKKKGKKSAGKKSDGKAARPSSAPSGNNLTEVGKEFFLIQIRDLEQRLGRYQRRCDELDVASGEFRDKHDQMSADKKEIVSFLKKQLEQRQDEIADLNDRLVGLQQSKDTEKDAYEQQLAQLRTEFQETKDQLTSENMILSGKLASLEEFKIQKADLMAKFAQMGAELSDQHDNHEEHIYQLERKHVVDKDRLKKEMVLKVNQVAAEFRKVSNKQMADTTKRAIRENVSIQTQLGKMSDKTVDLIRENESLSSKVKQQRQQLDMLEENEKVLAKRNLSNQKVIRMLSEKAKEQEALIMEYENKEQHNQEVEAEVRLLRQQMEASREEIQRMGEGENRLEEQLEMMTKERDVMKNNKEKMERIMAEAAYSLHKILMGDDTKKDGSKSNITAAELEERDSMLENLLVILNTAAAVGVGPTTSEFMRDEEVTYRTKSRENTFPGSAKGLNKGLLSLSASGKPTGVFSHYQLGDLGLVPRPKNDRYSFEKTRQLSATSRLNRLQGVQARSVGIQTASIPQAMFFSEQLSSKDARNAQSAIIRELALKDRKVLKPIYARGKHVH